MKDYFFWTFPCSSALKRLVLIHHYHGSLTKILQEKSKMEIELEGLKRRLNKAERELVNSKEECIHLTTNTQALEREVCNSAIF